ncbi:hypothetical protein AVEN_28573-1 [Araneus ventricosus]|uniref:HTH psq-type domain-containing protein n=1 Tax=Araneus ventricosus TaxID=182803 RepID=A0A4Y2K1B7_ARAVE|nr:hypothetical protein AVEN_28573-1 [Araneus ventricosus]
MRNLDISSVGGNAENHAEHWPLGCNVYDDKDKSATKLAAEFGIKKATICDWKKNRSKIEQFSSTTSRRALKKRKTLKVSHYENIDEALPLVSTGATKRDADK